MTPEYEQALAHLAKAHKANVAAKVGATRKKNNPFTVPHELAHFKLQSWVGSVCYARMCARVEMLGVTESQWVRNLVESSLGLPLTDAEMKSKRKKRK